MPLVETQAAAVQAASYGGRKAFGNPKEGTAKWKNMQNAIETGKIQAGRAGLRKLRNNLEKLLGRDVHISIIKKGGNFDNGIIIPLSRSTTNK